MPPDRFRCLPRYERSWGVFFETFEGFLTFSWPVITVTDCWTGKAHIVTRANTIGAFLKMIKTRYVWACVSKLRTPIQQAPFQDSERHFQWSTIFFALDPLKLHSDIFGKSRITPRTESCIPHYQLAYCRLLKYGFVTVNRRPSASYGNRETRRSWPSISSGPNAMWHLAWNGDMLRRDAVTWTR